MIDDAVLQSAHQDDLTGLPNRRAILGVLADTIASSRREARPVALLLLSPDSLRVLREGPTPADADRVLVEFASRLSAGFGPSDRVARFPGDVFAVVMPGLDSSQAGQAADTFRAGLKARPLTLDGRPLDLGLHAGAASFPAEARDVGSLVDAADRALYHATRIGRDTTSGAHRLDAEILAGRARFDGLPCPAFVGREVELARARKALDDPASGRLLIVEGAPGSGKSRLLSQIGVEAATRGLLFLSTACSEVTRTTIGHSIVSISERFFRIHPDQQEALGSLLSEAQRHVAAALLPSLAAWKTGATEPRTKDRKPVTLEVLETALLVMTRTRPTLVALDNAQFADRATLNILRRVALDAKAPLIIALAAPLDLGPREFREAFHREGRADRIPLGPLTRADVVAMVEAILRGAPRPEGFDDRIFELSQGNPAYVEEALRSLLLRDRLVRTAQGFVFPGPDPVGNLPGSLEDAVKAVLRHLPPGTGEIITNAAVLGTKFDVQVLQETGGQREAPTLEAVDLARATGIIRVQDDGDPDRLEFTHDTIRRIQYLEIPEAKRREIHRRVARVGEARGRSASEVLYHQARAAGLDLDPDDPSMEVVPGAPPLRIPRIPEGAAPLEAEGARRLHTVLKALSAVLKVVRLYSKASTTTAQFRAQLQTVLADLLSLQSPVTLAVDAAGLSVNGRPLESGGTAAEIAQLFSDRAIGSLTLQRGLDPHELDALVTSLTEPMREGTAPRDHWDRFLDREGIRNFDIAQTLPEGRRPKAAPPEATLEAATFELTEPAKPAPPAPAAEPEFSRPPAESPDEVRDARADVRARAYLQMPAEKLLTDAFQREFIPAIEALNFGWTHHLAAQLIAHVAGFSLHPRKEIKLKALYLLLKAFRNLTGDSRGLLQDATKMPLQKHFEVESDDEVVQVSAEVARAWLDNALAAGRLRDVAEFLMRLTMVQTIQGSTLLGYRSSLGNKLTRLVTPDRVRAFLEALKSEKPADREAASQILGALGASVVAPLVKFVKETEELPPRLAAVHALQSIGGQAQQDLGRELTPEVEPAVAVRILGILEQAGNGPLATPILAAVHHRDERVREAGWDLIHRISDKVVAGAILRRLITGEAGPAQKRAIDAAAKLGIADLAGEVKRLLLATEDDAFARTCVEYFRSVPSAWAVPALKRVLEMRPRMFGIVKGFSDETRTLAVMAARVTPSRDVQAFLEAARKDPSPQIRQAAQ